MDRHPGGGGWPAIRYALNVADRVGWLRLWRALRSKNTCKTCALGMGGQRGGMRNELGRWPEVCKKSLQAMAADMQDGLRPEFFRRYSLDALRTLSPRELESAGRLVRPMIATPGDTHYRPITWGDALQRIAKRLRKTHPDRGFFYVSGRSSNEAGFLLQLFARLWGTNHVNNCSYYCHQASGVGLTGALGSGTATLLLEDVEHADLFFLIGGNPASNHPRLMRTLMNIRRGGGHVIVINPVREAGLVRFRVPSDLRSLLFGSDIASEYIQPHIGGDIAVLTGIAKIVLERGGAERAFIDRATEGWAEYRSLLESTTWDEIERAGGVEREAIERVADRYLTARNVVFAWTMGITHHVCGVKNVQTIVNLALMRGMVGRRNAGLLPIRGHSNVQGIGSVGVTPKLKQAIFEGLENRYGLRLPKTEGLDTMGCMEAADRGEMDLGWCLGGNLYGANPDAAFARRSLGKIETMIYMSTTLNTGHAHGLGRETILLPVLARDEEPQKTTQESMFNYVRLSEGGPPRHNGPRSEIAVIAQIANAVLDLGGMPKSQEGGISKSHEGGMPKPKKGGMPKPKARAWRAESNCHSRSRLGNDNPIDWLSMQHHPTIRHLIADIVPGYEKLAEIDRTREEFQITGRTFHTPVFPTPSGRASFHAHPIPSLSDAMLTRPGLIGTGKHEPCGPGAQPVQNSILKTQNSKLMTDPLRLMTVRSEGQFNTVVYEEEDLYRGQTRRDVILMNPADIDRRGLSIDQPVTIRSETGEMPGILVRSYDIHVGNALMYFPEANLLVPRTVDPNAKTPAYKSILITIDSM